MINILILASTHNFLCNSLVSLIGTDEKFTTKFSCLSMEELSQLTEQPDVLVLHSDAVMLNMPTELLFVRDYLAKDNASVFITGGEDEFKELTKIFAQNHTIVGTFTRPLNARDIAKQICEHSGTAGTKLVKKKILVVDDSGPMLRSVKEWLEPKYSVSIANSGVSAIKSIAMNSPDLVLLDFEMPVCNGPQVLKMIRDDPESAGLPVIFLTSRDDAAAVREVMSCNANGYLLKTLPPDRIVATVDSFFKKNS